MLEDRKTKNVLKVVMWVAVISTIIPNIVPLYSSLPRINSLEMEYTDGIHFTIYLILGVLIPLLIIRKSNNYIDTLIYSINDKTDYTESIRLVAKFIIILAIFSLFSVRFYDSYVYTLNFKKIFWLIIGFLLLTKQEKINARLLMVSSSYEDKKRNVTDEWDELKN